MVGWMSWMRCLAYNGETFEEFIDYVAPRLGIEITADYEWLMPLIRFVNNQRYGEQLVIGSERQVCAGNNEIREFNNQECSLLLTSG